MSKRIPTVPAVMTGLLGVFMIVAGFGTIVPGFVHDRLNEQFIPTWDFLLGPLFDVLEYDAMRSAEVALHFARASQWIITGAEWAIGAAMLAATFMPRHRLALTNFGAGLAIGLFGTFMLAMFAMHDKSLPAWNQYPAMLAWFGVTWLVVALTADRGAEQNGR